MKNIGLVLASNMTRIKQRFAIPNTADYPELTPNFNIRPGDYTTLITNNQTREPQQFKFGLQVNKSKVIPLPFVRAEGDRNKNDDPIFTGTKGIFLKPEFRLLIGTQRCLILADAFFVYSETTRPYLVYLCDKNRPFAFAGIFNKLRNEETNEVEFSFAIITTTANALMQSLGHKRMPVILSPGHESTWLRTSSQLSSILDCLNPFPTELMNAYPLSDKIKTPENNSGELIHPIGEKIYAEKEKWVYSRKKKPVYYQTPKLTMGEKAKAQQGK